MLRGGEHGHIHSNFRDNANSGKGLDTRSRHYKIKLWKILFSSSQNQRFQIKLAQFQTVHVGTDDAELFSLFGTHLSVYGGEDLLISRLHAFGTEAGDICNLLGWVVQQPRCNCGCGFAKDIRKYIVQFDVGNGKAILSTIFLASSEICELPAVANQISKLANVCRRNEASCNKVVLKDVSNPLGISLVSFFTTNCFHILRVRKDDVAVRL